MLINGVGHPLLANFTNSSFVGPSSTWLASQEQYMPSETGDVSDFGMTMVVRPSLNISLAFVLIAIFVGTVHPSEICFTTWEHLYLTFLCSGNPWSPGSQRDLLPYVGFMVGNMFQLLEPWPFTFLYATHRRNDCENSAFLYVFLLQNCQPQWIAYTNPFQFWSRRMWLC